MPLTITVLDSTGATQTVATNDAVIAKLPAALGSAASAAALPVVIANDQGAVATSVADGSNVTQGARADLAYAGTGSASVVSILKGLYTALVSALPAGTNIIGRVGIDQTTPGTTNGVQINAALPAGGNIVGKFGIDQTTPGTTNGVQVNAALPAGGNIVGKFGIDQTTPGTTNGVQVNAALPAGTNTIGQVNGNGASVEVVPTVTAGAYTAGNVIGGIMTFAGVLPASFNGILESITLKFKGSAQTTEFDVAIFSASPTGTFTDHAAPAIAATDSALLLGIFQLTVNLSPLGTHTVYTLDGIAKQIVGTSTSLFVVVTTKSAVTPASTTDMSLRLGVAW